MIYKREVQGSVDESFFGKEMVVRLKGHPKYGVKYDKRNIKMGKYERRLGGFDGGERHTNIKIMRNYSELGQMFFRNSNIKSKDMRQPLDVRHKNNKDIKDI